MQKLIAPDAVKRIEQAMHKRLHILRRHPMVRDIRGLDAIWAVELPDAKLRDRLIEIGEEMAHTDGCGFKLLAGGEKSVRLMPPLTISPKNLKKALDIFVVVLNKLRDEKDSYSIWI